MMDTLDELLNTDKLAADLFEACKPLLDKADQPAKFVWHSTTIIDGELIIWFEQDDDPDHVWQVRIPLGDDLEGTPATLHRLTG